MKKRSNLKLATKQTMSLSRRTIVVGCSVVAIAAASISVWQLSNSEKSVANTLKTTSAKTAIIANASENADASTARTETIAKQFTASAQTEKATAATLTRTATISTAMGMATEEQALDVIARQLSEDFNGKTSMVMMETPAGKVNMGAVYTYPGRPDMSQADLEELRNSNKSSAPAPAATAHLTASTDAAPDLTVSENNGLRKFEVVSADKVKMESVKLVKFDIQKKFNNVLLSWNTDVERYNDYYAVEKSTDGKTFKEIGRVNGAGDYKDKLLYAFVDRKPSEGSAWYRIHQYDFSGNEKVFTAKKVK